MKKYLAFLCALLWTALFSCSALAQIDAASPTPVASPAATLLPENTATPEPAEMPAETPAPKTNTEQTVVGRLSGLIIGIDPGHQAHQNTEREPISPNSKEKKAKVSSGTSGVSSKTPEHVVNLQVSLKLRDALLAEGATVVMTRETADVNISNIERAVMMNEAKADLVLRIHCNGADGKKPSGTALYVKKHGACAAESADAAKLLLEAMVKETGARDRGIVRNDDYTGLNWSEVPAILVEMGFMSNPAEDMLLNDPAYQDKLVRGMVAGIAAYFKRDTPPEPESTLIENLPEDVGE